MPCERAPGTTLLFQRLGRARGITHFERLDGATASHLHNCLADTNIAVLGLARLRDELLNYISKDGLRGHFIVLQQCYRQPLPCGAWIICSDPAKFGFHCSIDL
jgi:hypothetical protein